MWGFAGILSFGHAAYFGLGAYTYAIAAMTVGESTGPVLLAIVLPAAVAAVIGAMMFYGRISDVYMGVITLVVTLILFKFMNATAGDAYRIGSVKLGGFNGIPAFPILNLPGDPNVTAFGTPFYYVVCVCSPDLLPALPLDPRLLLRQGADRHPRERGAGRAARLQRAAVQDGDLHDERRHGGARRLPVRELGRDRHARRVQPRAVGRGDHLDDRRRPRHARRPDRRRDRPRLPEAAARPADADRQLARPRLHPVLVVLLLPSGLLPALGRWRERRDRASVSRRQASSTRRRRGVREKEAA